MGPRIATLYANQGLGAVRPFVWQASGLFFVPLAGLCAFMALFGGMLLSIIYGAGFVAGATALIPLSISLLAIALAFFFFAGSVCHGARGPRL